MNNYYKELISNYLDSNILPYAILLNGAWGCGKTWYLTNKFEKDFSGKKIIYTSVNGATSIDDISQQIVASKISGFTGIDLGPKGKIVADVLKRFGSNFIEKWIGLSLKDGKTLTQLVTINKDEVLVVDDLERIKSPLTIGEIFGYLNSNFTEASHTKVILVADEKELLKTLRNEKEEYLRTKEKTIWQTVTYTTDFECCFNELASLFEEETKDRLQRHKDFLISRFELFNIQNLRWVLYFFNVIKSLKDFLEYDNKYVELILSSALILTSEYKRGKLNVKFNGAIPPYIKTNIPTISFTEGELFECDETGFHSLERKSEKNGEVSPSEIGMFSKKYLDSEEKRYHYFESLFNLVCFGTLNADLFKQEIDSYINSVSKSQPWHLVIDNLISLTNLEDAKFNQIWNEMIGYLMSSKYKLNDLRNIAGVYEVYVKLGIKFPTKKKELYIMLKKQILNCNENEREDFYYNIREEMQGKSKEFSRLIKLTDRIEERIFYSLKANNINTIIEDHINGQNMSTANFIDLISFGHKNNIDKLITHAFSNVQNCRIFEKLLNSSFSMLRSIGCTDNRKNNLKRIIAISAKLSKHGSILRFYSKDIEKQINEKVFNEWG